LPADLVTKVAKLRARAAAHAEAARTAAAPKAATKVGRNDPCPCGRGKKYKKCCIDSAPDA
ncbi:MAG: SEC-C metal-binding domain-containing protein, partial [Polyangiales bacterium]